MDDKTLLALFDKFEKSSAAELKYSGNGFNFELRRKEAFSAMAAPTQFASPVAGPAAIAGAAVAAPTAIAGAAAGAAAAAPVIAHASSAAPHAHETASGQSAAAGNEYIKSPIVGTFYRSPSPDAPAFSDIGKKIAKGQKLCIIEAMKMMNALEAEFDCEIVKILVNNGDMVEFDQPLFEVRAL